MASAESPVGKAAVGSERVSQSHALKMRRTKRVNAETEAAAVTELTAGCWQS